MSTLTINPDLAAELEKAATAEGKTSDELAERAIRQFLRDEARRQMQRESEAYRAMHARLLTQHANEYVAVHQGQLIDHDVNQLALALRIQAAYPNKVVLIRQVLPEPDEVYTVRSPRLIHDR